MKAQTKAHPLTFRDAMHLKTAQTWLCLGELSQAIGAALVPAAFVGVSSFLAALAAWGALAIRVAKL